MERYDYLKAMTADIIEYLHETYTDEELTQCMENADDFEEKLHDDLWIEDSVTGNASGSYTFSTWKAEEYIAHNLDLLAEALREFGCDVDVLEKGAEWCDVTIRCYLLGTAIAKALYTLID